MLLVKEGASREREEVAGGAEALLRRPRKDLEVVEEGKDEVERSVVEIYRVQRQIEEL